MTVLYIITRILSISVSQNLQIILHSGNRNFTSLGAPRASYFSMRSLSVLIKINMSNHCLQHKDFFDHARLTFLDDLKWYKDAFSFLSSAAKSYTSFFKFKTKFCSHMNLYNLYISEIRPTLDFALIYEWAFPSRLNLLNSLASLFVLQNFYLQLGGVQFYLLLQIFSLFIFEWNFLHYCNCS